MPAATAQPAAVSPPAEPMTPAAVSPQAPSPPVAQEAARPAPSRAQSPRPHALLTVTLGAAALLALGWVGVRVLRPHRAEAPPSVQASGESLSQTPLAAAPAQEGRPPAAAVSGAKSGGIDRVTSPAALHEVFPEVPWRARRTIRGHINIWVRLIVDQDGSVLAASEDRTGPSRYFQRLAIEAAKKWTFPPVDAPSRRLMQVRFDFTRDGTTGRAVALD
jgi:outer membrane biosynthesis protein TonB